MNTDYLVRLQMCGYSRIEAILILDEISEDGEEVVENFLNATEREVRNVRVLQSKSGE